MAQIYVGNLESVDRGTLNALRQLNDEFVVLAEFRIPRTSRQVDFFIARVDQPTCCLFLIEAKNESRRLRGTVDGIWEFEDSLRPGVWLPLPPPNERDANPLQQAINTANVLKDWMISMQPLLQDGESPWVNPMENLTVFPRLLMPFAHQLSQLQTDRFAYQFTTYGEALASLGQFRGRRELKITRRNIERMADHLGLRPYGSTPRDQESTSAQIQRLSMQVSALQRDIVDIKRLLMQLAGADRKPVRANGADGLRSASERPAVPEREASFDVLVDLVRELRDAEQTRLFNVVHEIVRERFGDLPNDQVPYERFKDYVQEAQRRGFVRLVRVGPVDHILLSDEPIAPYIAAVRREQETSQVPAFEG